MDISADPEKLLRAYGTLKDERQRRNYDLIYASLKEKTAPSQNARETNIKSHSNTAVKYSK